MSHKVTAKDFNKQDCLVHVDALHPDYCPYCRNHVQPTLIASHLNGHIDESPVLDRVYRCTNSKCGRTFLAVYEGVKQTGGGARWYFLKSIRPGDPEPPEIPKNVATISPNFVKIYTQASDAEQHGLSEICGGGYRKALEFLVKDFIISQAESLGITGDQVKKASLGQCIENYISDPLTKGVAERATWLGNDETHYFRKWVDKDINDLKNLIRLTMNAVDNHLLAHSYLADMGEGK